MGSKRIRVVLAVLMALAGGQAGALVTPLSGIVPAASCGEQRQREAGETLEARKVALQSELQNFTRLAEETLATRAAAIGLYRELQDKMARHEPFSGRDLQRLHEGSTELLAQRTALMEAALAHECWIGEKPQGGRDDAALRAAGVTMSLSAALLLYDNYLSAVALYRDNAALRQQLNQADRGLERRSGELSRMALAFTSAENRRRVRRAIRWYEKQALPLGALSFEGYAYVAQLVEQSPSYRMVRSADPLRYIGRNAEMFGRVSLDTVRGVGREGSSLSSMLFGNTVGLIETRHGKLWERSEVIERVGQTLRTGDILLEKTPFRLTDTFIPGHWGHAAVWVGSEAELRELGIWDHPLVRAHQREIREGRGVVEALRSGVEMNTARRFLNIDDLAVLRHDTLSREARAGVVLQALSHVGKGYDFNFNAESTDRIFCSKLVYLVYGDLGWPTSRMLGRATISPDNVAQRAIGDGPLNVALLYHDGAEVPAETARRRLEQLLQPEQLARR